MQPIGMFDSGVGGLTVLKEVKRLLPHQKVVYFGDTARIPYGDKSPQTIIRYALQNSSFLMEHNINMLIVACNTASAHSLATLREKFSIPIIDVIEPSVQKAVKATKQGRIAILGTKGTIRSNAYQKALLEALPQAELIGIACPLFVPLIEEMFLDHEITKLAIQEYLRPLKERNIDTLLLGCTHYPLLKTFIQDEVGSEVTIIDSATSCAEIICERLKETNDSSKPQIDEFFVSDDPEKFKALGELFLGSFLMNVRQVPSLS